MSFAIMTAPGIFPNFTADSNAASISDILSAGEGPTEVENGMVSWANSMEVWKGQLWQRYFINAQNSITDKL